MALAAVTVTSREALAETGAATKPGLAVLPLTAQRVPQDVVAILDDLVLNQLHAAGRFEVMSVSDMNSILGFEKVKSIASCSDVACASDIGGALGVRYLLAGSVSRLGKQIIISLKLLDTQQPKVVARAESTVDDDETRYAEGIRTAVLRLLGIGVAEAAKPAPVPMRFVSKPAGAAVTLDGAGVGVAPLVAPVTPGEHTVAMALAGRESRSQRFTVKAGDRQHDLELTLPAAPARLMVTTTPPGALVRAGRFGKSCTSNCELVLDAGKYTVHAELAGHEELVRDVELLPGKELPLGLVMTPVVMGPAASRSTGLKRGAIAVTGLTVAAAAVFAWKGLEARNSQSDLAAMPWGSAADSKLASGRSAARIADVALVTTVVSAAVSGYLWYRARL